MLLPEGNNLRQLQKFVLLLLIMFALSLMHKDTFVYAHSLSGTVLKFKCVRIVHR